MATNRACPITGRNEFHNKVVALSSHGTASRIANSKPPNTVNEMDLLKFVKLEGSVTDFSKVAPESDPVYGSSPLEDPPSIKPAILLNRNLSIFTKMQSSEQLLLSAKKIKTSSGEGSEISHDPICPISYLMLEFNNQNDSTALTDSQVKVGSKFSRRNQTTNPEFNKARHHHKLKERCHKSKSQVKGTAQENMGARTLQTPKRGVTNTHNCNILQYGRNGNLIHLSPRMQSLKSFFEKKRSAAEAWKAESLYDNKARTPGDLQWAARQLRSFSTNNRLNSVTPGRSNAYRLASDMTGAEYGDFLRPNVTSKPKGERSDKEKNVVSDLGTFHLEETPPGDKVTPEAQEILLVLRDTVAIIINDIITIDQGLAKRNFKPCFSIVEHLEMIPEMLIALIDHLYYTPQEFELVAVAKNINSLIAGVLKDPVIVLFKMIELGHYLYYLGRILGEKIVPRDLPRLLHSIQVKLQRIKIGYVIRQYFHVPISMDFILTPYNKDRQLSRLEEECHCVVNLLHPEDPRSKYCPPSYRTIEVVYDEELGHFESFQHRLNRILTPQRCTARLISTILRQFDGREVVMTAEHAAYLLNSDHRPRYDDIRAFVVSGCRPRADRLSINVLKKRVPTTQKYIEALRKSLYSFHRELSKVEKTLTKNRVPHLDPVLLSAVKSSAVLQRLCNDLRLTSLEKALCKVPELQSAASQQSGPKCQPFAIARTNSQPGTITVNISLLQTNRKGRRCLAQNHRDETVFCEVSCEQSNDEDYNSCDAPPTCDFGVGTHDECRKLTNKFTSDRYDISSTLCEDEYCPLNTNMPTSDCCGRSSKRCENEVAEQYLPSFGKDLCGNERNFGDVCEVVEGFRKSKMHCSSLRSRRAANADPRENLNKMIARSQITPSWKGRTPDPGLLKIDEATDARTPGLYQGRMGKSSRFCELYTGANETAEARSNKITEESMCYIREMYKVVGTLFQRLSEAVDLIPCRDFSLCGQILGLMQQFHENFVNMLKCLRYSPYEEEMLPLNAGLDQLLEELEVQPAFVLVRMIEFGYFLYEIGRLLNEEFIPPCFVALIHKIQTRLYRLRSGRVVRQIFFVPNTYDPIVSTYYKSRQILRIENFCRCKVVLLPPEDPRAIDCPMGWRCLEVNFDEQHGRYLAFKKLLVEACPVPLNRPIVSIATVFRRLNGSEGQMSLEELCNYEVSRPRVSIGELAHDIRSKCGLASLPRLKISKH
ncbi:unnamed protein product [Hydatigera taeniaeformis]|uniref:DH domain-containing protein n=1 Tax=Hydatigena taeniaeformis TaxID=6205 RepID=A0A158RE53_HYDTA|nr:unnamed protein product [Hydatigera taeniaeformis]